MNNKRQDIISRLQEAKKKVALLEKDLLEFDSSPGSSKAEENDSSYPLSLQEYERYNRQMILAKVGLHGQLKLRKAKILVVGAGGLGCPVLLYLAAAGVGRITILDHDTVELSNLHRQVLHSEAKIGMNKAVSATLAILALNSDISVTPIQRAFTPDLFLSKDPEIEHIISADFDLVLDCTDNPSTRHFINTYAVAHSIPLISGGAVRIDGTVGVYNLGLEGEERGPCYACVFPPVIPTEMSDEQIALQGTGACSDEGVLGILVGVVGLSMCAETIRAFLGSAKPTMHLFAPLGNTPCRTIRLRARKPTCPTCSPEGGITIARRKWDGFVESRVWEGWQDPHCELPGVGERAKPDDYRIDVKSLKQYQESNQNKTRFIDVRPETQFEICHLEGSENIPLATLLRDPSVAGSDEPVVFICRRGNDSLLCARAVKRLLGEGHQTLVADVKGGLIAWKTAIDPNLPIF